MTDIPNEQRAMYQASVDIIVMGFEQTTAAEWREYRHKTARSAWLAALTPAVDPAAVILTLQGSAAQAEVLARALDRIALLETRLAELAPQVDLGK